MRAPVGRRVEAQPRATDSSGMLRAHMEWKLELYKYHSESLLQGSKAKFGSALDYVRRHGGDHGSRVHSAASKREWRAIATPRGRPDRAWGPLLPILAPRRVTAKNDAQTRPPHGFQSLAAGCRHRVRMGILQTLPVPDLSSCTKSTADLQQAAVQRLEAINWTRRIF
jgi:hypothetical protein